ncbi:glucosaminidase domain-containing protein [Listeria sp. ILCC792]|uniref:glucosaminidase domain-containing protein n=1 Tax=Listeria sp. ILCC792 TaxID=1918331 RepID=UPI000B590D35|nr:glucosaminidase domain-containing protein [Listeria sp. ILCC792]
MKKIKHAVIASVIATSALLPFATVQAEAADKSGVTASLQGMTVSQQQFVQDIAPKAQELQKKYGVLTSVTIAQAIVESNWGNSGLSTQANNLFGIKGSYNGDSITMQTTEYAGDEAYKTDAAFRSYPSRAASVEDHTMLFVNGISGDPYLYHDVLNETDYKQVSKAIQEAGYATDPNYANTLIQTIERYNLTAYDDIYDSIQKSEYVLAYGKMEDPKNAAIWTSPYGTKGAKKVANASAYKEKSLRLGKKVTTESGDWYEIFENGKRLGYVDTDVVEIFYTPKNEVQKEMKKYVVENDQKIYTYPVEDSSQIKGNLNDLKGKKVTIDKRADVNNEYWYRITDKDGKSVGWSKAPGFSDNNPNK